MKKTKILAISFFALLALSCAKENPLPENSQELEVKETITIQAGFAEDTKVTLAVNSTYAKPVWRSNDQFAMYSILSSGGYYKSIFTTEEDNVAKASFTGAKFSGAALSDRDLYLSMYPLYAGAGDSSKNPYSPAGNGTIRLYVPSVQTPVENNIPGGITSAFAVTDNPENDLSFINLNSIIRFKLSGAAVSQVASVTFVANCNICGDVLAQDVDTGTPTFNTVAYFEPRIEPSGNTITLSGAAFTAGEYYYMVTLPGNSNGYSMVFRDSDGRYIVKSSMKTLALQRSRIQDFGTIDIGDSFESYSDPNLVKYISCEPGLFYPIPICILSDGYKASQREKFESDAKSAIDYFFQVEPYKTYKGYFNVYLMWVPSEDEGATVTDGNGHIIMPKNTAFGSRWGSGYRDMVADADKVYGYAESHCPEILSGQKTIDEAPVLILINDTRYGGIAHTSTTGRTYCMAPLSDEGTSLFWTIEKEQAATSEGTNTYVTYTSEQLSAQNLTYTGNWKNIVLHEFGGHSFARLADEYWSGGTSGRKGTAADTAQELEDHAWPVPFSLNVSTQYDNVPWKPYFLDNLSILSASKPDYSRIGLWQGGNYNMFYTWRSEITSCMIDNRPYFSAWQRYLIYDRIVTLAVVRIADDNARFNDFLSRDVTEDPVRAGTDPAHAPAHSSAHESYRPSPLRYYPPLPPPVFDDIPINRL